MFPSLQRISDSYIPPSSAGVRYCFDAATTPDSVVYGRIGRCFWATVAITCSATNSIGHGFFRIGSSIATAFIHRDFKDLTEKCKADAMIAHQSIKFVAAMTTYLFMSIFGYSLVLPRPITPYELRAEYRAPILQSNVPIALTPPKCDVPTLGFDLYADTTGLKIDTASDRNFLLTVLESRKDLVLILSSDAKAAYIISRSNPLVKTGVMAGELKFFDLAPDVIPIASPTPPPPTIDDLSAADLQRSMTRSAISQLSTSRIADQFVPVHQAADASPPTSATAYLGHVLRSAWTTAVGSDHRIKEMKYRHILSHLFKAVTNLAGLALYNQVCSSQVPESPLKAKCLELYQILAAPTQGQDIRSQHQAFILALREARDLLKDNDPVACKNWIEFLALQRFAGIKLGGYCRALVEKQTSPFDGRLTLDTFVNELDRRNKRVAQIPVEEGLNYATRQYQRITGHFNWKDFLLKYNIPYIYGVFKRIGKKAVTILRHGSPVEDYYLIGSTKVTSDHCAFVEAAAANGESILHVILENGVPKDTWLQKAKGGEESHRVRARLAVGDQHNNFYPMALRLDGPFVQPHHYTAKTFDQLKIEFANEMFGDNTGYIIHDNLTKKGLNRQKFYGYMEKVKTTYFPQHTSFDTLPDFQAFIVLTYAEMILSLCDALDISYLEAGCKDDIDRGGAMKAILTFVHLYRTGKFGTNSSKQELTQALEDIMTNIIAAPLIVRKDEIIESRADYVKHVVAVLQRVVAQAPVPAEAYEGGFEYPTELYQGLALIGNTCRNEAEYQEFLQTARQGKIEFKAELSDKNLVQDCSAGKTEGKIQHQVELEYKRMNMWLNNQKLKSGLDISASLIRELERYNIKDQAAWRVLSVFNQSIGVELVSSLTPLFNHEALGYIVSPDNERMMTDNKAGLSLTLVQDKASIKFVLLFKIISPAADGKVIGHVRSTLEIPDHRVAGATVTTTVDPISTG
jgi:hypothetical protein